MLKSETEKLTQFAKYERSSECQMEDWRNQPLAERTLSPCLRGRNLSAPQLGQIIRKCGDSGSSCGQRESKDCYKKVEGIEAEGGYQKVKNSVERPGTIQIFLLKIGDQSAPTTSLSG